MGTTYRWAQPVVVREQRTLFQPTLDDMIPQDHEVRLLDETLRTLEWSPWEAKYKRGGPGQPPIHPQVPCGRVGLSGPGRALSAAETATLPEGEFNDSPSTEVDIGRRHMKFHVPPFSCTHPGNLVSSDGTSSANREGRRLFGIGTIEQASASA